MISFGKLNIVHVFFIFISYFICSVKQSATDRGLFQEIANSNRKLADDFSIYPENSPRSKNIGIPVLPNLCESFNTNTGDISFFSVSSIEQGGSPLSPSISTSSATEIFLVDSSVGLGEHKIGKGGKGKGGEIILPPDCFTYSSLL
jgi:hypothetical protein